MILPPQLSDFNLNINLLNEKENLERSFSSLKTIIILITIAITVVISIIGLGLIDKNSNSSFILILNGGLIGWTIGVGIIFLFKTHIKRFILSSSKKYRRMSDLQNDYNNFVESEKRFNNKIYQIIELYNQLFQNENYIIARQESFLPTSREDIIEAYKYFFNSDSIKANSYYVRLKDSMIENAGLLDFFVEDSLAIQLNKLHLKIKENQLLEKNEREIYNSFITNATMKKQKIIMELRNFSSSSSQE
jgi:hypothetical protein